MQSPTKPLVSVIVPVYNGERYLRESVTSILSQTYRNIEFFFMDDASTDGAPLILAEFAAGDDRVRIERQSANRGIHGNINSGIALASGEYVAIHHSDDLYQPELLARQVSYLQANPEIGAVFCLDRFIDENGREYGRVELPADIPSGEPLDLRAILNGILRYENVFLRANSSLIKRSVYEEVGPFDEQFDLRADLDMWLRIAEVCRIAILDEHLVAYRYGHDNSSARYDRLRTEQELWFTVVDRFLASGGRSLAEPDALAAYEGHRAEDLLMVAVNQYIAGSLAGARQTLSRVMPATIARTNKVQRVRLLLLLAGLQLVTRLPHSGIVGGAFKRRWHPSGSAGTG